MKNHFPLSFSPILGLIIFGAVSLYPAYAGELPSSLLGGCFKVPAIDPSKDFVANFNNSCYTLQLTSSRGADKAGDLNAVYSQAYYKITPGYELVLLGSYPNSRFFSVTVYDSHAAVTSNTIDTQILPLTGSMFNPFLSTAPYQSNQQYGITIGLGGGSLGNITAGCNTSDTTIDQNFLDASQIHQGITWNGYSGLPEGFPVHQTGANDAGAVIVRSYYDLLNEPPTVLIVRQLSDGCAVPVKNVSDIITTDQSGANWSNASQIDSHLQFSNQIKPIQCYPPDPLNHLTWVRSADYVPGDNGAAGYLFAPLSSSLVSSIRSSKEFIRMQFQLPTFPDTPCSSGGCGLTGLEQVRYYSISFEDSKTTTYLSIKDSDMVQDAYGNVTLIIGMGTKPPSYVTAQNGYTYFDLSKVSGYKNVANIAVRNILPNPTFNCSNENVPFYTSEYNPQLGYMGNYVPTIDFPTGSEIPTVPVPVNRPNSCGAQVSGASVSCGTENEY